MERVLEAAEHGLLRAALALPRPVMRLVAGPRVVYDGQLLDVETQWMLRLRRLAGHPPAESLPVEVGRRVVSREARVAGGRQPVGSVHELEVPGGAGPRAARLYEPRAAVAGPGAPDGPAGSAVRRTPLLVYLHGGGTVYGDLDSHDAVCRFLAERAATRVLAVDYRRAPEHPFPGAVEDAWAAYRWVVDHADSLGADPDRLAVGGDSAGGYLAAVVAMRAARAALPLRVQLLVYPLTDVVEHSRSRRDLGEGFFLTEAFIQVAERSWLGGEPGDPGAADPADPEVSVLRTRELPGGLAPALVVTAGFDPLRDEGEAWAARLADGGVEVVLRRYPDLVHGFLNVVGAGRRQRAAVAEVAALLRAALHR